MAIVLAVDSMGGDHGVNITVPSCLRFLDETVDVNLILVGDRDSIYKQIGDKLSQYSDRIEVFIQLKLWEWTKRLKAQCDLNVIRRCELRLIW